MNEITVSVIGVLFLILAFDIQEEGKYNMKTLDSLLFSVSFLFNMSSCVFRTLEIFPLKTNNLAKLLLKSFSFVFLLSAVWNYPKVITGMDWALLQIPHLQGVMCTAAVNRMTLTMTRVSWRAYFTQHL